MSAYYNEHDSKAAAWLRELISAGLVAPGDVDERSILEVRPHELTHYTQQHFFAGIGGWSYALRLAGWPDARPVRTGSCPCQPFSVAGKGLAEKDARHLWPAFRDLITFGEPTVTFGEQVASAAGREWLAGVRADLEALGYEVGAADLCAAGAGAPHIRQRLWWVAVADRWERDGLAGGEERERDGAAAGREQGDGELECGGAARGVADAAGARCDGAERDAEGEARDETRVQLPCADGDAGYWSRFDLLACRDGKARRVEPGTFPLADGVPGRVGLLRGYGNAIVPQQAVEFIRACVEAIG